MRKIRVSSTLTVYHDGQFWVGVFERVEDDHYRRENEKHQRFEQRREKRKAKHRGTWGPRCSTTVVGLI